MNNCSQLLQWYLKLRCISVHWALDIKHIPVEWARPGAGGLQALRLTVDFPREHVNFLPPWAYCPPGHATFRVAIQTKGVIPVTLWTAADMPLLRKLFTFKRTEISKQTLSRLICNLFYLGISISCNLENNWNR